MKCPVERQVASRADALAPALWKQVVRLL